jgi:hypothetical protein
MKTIILALVLLAQTALQAQKAAPVDHKAHILRLTEQIKAEPTNYELYWERLGHSVGTGPIHYELDYQPDTSNYSQMNGARIEFDFKVLYDNVIKPRKFKIVEEGDYYLLRSSFYLQVAQFDKALEDATHLRDKASYSKYSDRGEYYHTWALQLIYRVYTMQRNYDMALKSIDEMIRWEQMQDPAAYHSGFVNSSYEKIELMRFYKKDAELTEFLKKMCRDGFAWYFKYANPGDSDPKNDDESPFYDEKDKAFHLSAGKQLAFELLITLVEHLKTINSPELPKYQGIYDAIRFQRNPNYETIKPELSDMELRQIVNQL